MSLSAITAITSSSDASSALLSLNPIASVSSATQSSVSTAASEEVQVSQATAAAIRGTVSIPSSARSVTPPLSTDTLQLLQDLSTGNFSAAKSDVAKVQQDLQAQEAAPSPAAQATSSSTSSSTSDASITKLLTSLKESLESGDTGKALSIITGFLAQTTNFSGAIVNTSA
jgi:hypothetical protein